MSLVDGTGCDTSDGSSSAPVVVVSNDTHIGPRLTEDLRAYCPRAYLDEFDRFATATRADKEAATTMLEGSGYLSHPNLRTAGHHDSSARLADYDHDGVAAGVIFHGSMNFEPIPFVPSSLGQPKPAGDRELVGVGQRMYNRWLADFVSQAPARHIGLAYLPMWDVEAAIAEVKWAHDAGLRGVNFPAMRDGELLEYNRREWEPLWSVCEDLHMPLVTHVGGGTNARYSGLEGVALMQVESGGFVSRRAVWWLIFAGVFERHRGLDLVITETPGNWFAPLATELDALHAFYDAKRDQPLNKALLEQVPKRPSEYMANNVYFGASFASPHEVEQAAQHGIETQLLWGSDYPHLEGTFVYAERDGSPSVTRLALRNTFWRVPATQMRRMVGENAIGVYGLDATALSTIANEIGAPTVDELRTPIDAIPEGASLTAFRSGAGGWT
jgi:predicted TIM-barrel fold metal-dependent hydrolase